MEQLGVGFEPVLHGLKRGFAACHYTQLQRPNVTCRLCVSYGVVVMSWAAEEFKTIDLGDRRLDKGTVLLAERLAANPMASIPQACGGWAQTQAAYRFLAQDDIDWEAILAPH